MTTVVGPESRIESYLARVRAALRGLPESDIDDILRELSAHVLDLAGEEGADIEAALGSLGDPVDLAKTYKDENRVARAECTSSTLVILQGLRSASRNRWQRVIVTSLYCLGYSIFIGIWVTAIEHCFAPSRTGLWYTPGARWPLTLVTDGPGPAGAREVLRWWLVPALLVLGWGLKYVTDKIAQWWIGRYRHARGPGAA